MHSEAEYLIHGRVVDATTSEPLADLHVRAYDRNLIWDDCLGTDDTDANGEFRIPFFAFDVHQPGRPEIYIVVYGPGPNRVHFSDPVRPLIAARPTRVEIALPAKATDHLGTPGRLAIAAVG